MNKYRVKREGFTLGHVHAESSSEAQDRALDTYGLGAVIDPIPMQDTPVDIHDVIQNRDLSIRPIHQVKFLQARKLSQLQTNVNTFLLTLSGKFVSNISLNVVGGDYYTAMVSYFDLVEHVSAKTIAQLMMNGHGSTSPEEVEFGKRLLEDLATNENLFAYALGDLGIDWSRHPNASTDRVNCIQAIRRHHRWI